MGDDYESGDYESGDLGPINICIHGQAAYFCFLLINGLSPEEFRARMEASAEASAWPIIMTCQHGASVTWNSPADIPEVDTPMPCGHPDCWAIRYEKGQGNGV